jgi:hypothetical protein
LQQGSVDAELAKLRILLQLADLIDRMEVDPSCRLDGRVGLVLEAGNPFLDPAPEREINGASGRVQILRTAADSPALSMESDDRQTPFRRIEDVAVARIAALGLPRFWSRREDLLDRMGTRSTARGDEADLGDVAQSERWMLRFQIDDQPS